MSGEWENIEQKRHAEPCPRHAEFISVLIGGLFQHPLKNQCDAEVSFVTALCPLWLVMQYRTLILPH